MADTVRLAVMGAGLIGRRHVEHCLAHPDVSLAAVIDPTDQAHAFADANRTPWFESFDAMRAAGVRADGIIVATPNQLHELHATAVIAAGIPVLVEKPIADSVDAGRRLVEAGEAAGVPVLVGHHRRHNPMVQRAKAIVDSGRLGTIVSVHAFFWLMKPDDYFDVEWRRQPGAGPILVNLIHDVDLLRHLVGEIRSVRAVSNNDVRGFAIEETAAIIMRFAAGALATASISDTIVAPWNWEQTSGENPAYPHTDQSCYFIGGSHASLTVPRLEVWSNSDQRSWWEPFVTERTTAADADPLRLQIGQFCRVIRDGEAPLVSGREGLRTLAVIEAIGRAAKTGDEVAVTM